jgi:glycosyltransferase involved in cell wall biosynthesis
MNVLIVAPFYDEPPRRFIAAQAGARFLAARGQRVVVVTSCTGDYPGFEQRGNIKIYRVKPFIYLPAVPYVIDPLFWVKVIRIGSSEKVATGIAVMPQALTTFMLAFAKLFWKLPFAIWVTGAGASSGRPLVDWVSRVYDLTLLRFSMQMATQAWSMSEALNELIHTWGAKRSKIRIVPCQNIDTEMFVPKTDCTNVRAKWGIASDEKVVTCVGRLYPLKGINYLIEASSHIVRSCPQTRFVIVSQGPQYELLKAQAQVTAPGKFIFTGWVDQSQLQGIFNMTDIFVLPSLSEGVPTVVLEAYAYEIPVVATDVGATRDILHDGVNGYLIPPRDSLALSEGVLKLLQDDQLSRTMGKKNREFILHNFAKTDEQMGDFLLVRLNEMLKGAGSDTSLYWR